jgi:hypothetical protein
MRNRGFGFAWSATLAKTPRGAKALPRAIQNVRHAKRQPVRAWPGTRQI